ncbi:hypothetical protein OROMI_023709 [Orobanche minor]
MALKPAASCKLIWAGIILVAVWASDQATTSARTSPMNNNALMVEKHEQWMFEFGRDYNDDADEKAKRLEIFSDNVEYIESFNDATAGAKSYKLGLNKFADLTNEEFRASRNGYKLPEFRQNYPSMSLINYEESDDVPSSIDWREEGAVTGVKSQGECGGCWAFSAVAAVEGINKLKTNELVSLSEQELLDCDTSLNRGCNGGTINYAFDFITHNGLSSDYEYPYKGFVNGTCRARGTTNAAIKIKGYKSVPFKSESALLIAVAKQPVSVAIDSSGPEFQFYSKGVFNGVCGTELDHGVAVVGYGEDNGIKYWLVKNSWGPEWGEEGYIKLQRDIDAPEGLCGIAMSAAYPTA